MSVDLSFGDWGGLLVVETSLEPIHDRRILSLMIMNLEPAYPLTIAEENMTVVVDGHAAAFRMLRLNDDVWSAVAAVGDRWVLIRGIGIPAEGIAIEQIEAG